MENMKANNSDFPISSVVVSLSQVLENKYVIPAYQRPYEWNEKNIRSFLNSIIEGYRNKKQVFFGTIQVANNRLKKDVWDIVDGQQRLTTFIILLNILGKMINGESFHGEYMEIIEDNPVKDMFSENTPRIADKYIENKEFIIHEINAYEDELNDISDFLTFVKNNVYFVMLTTLNMPLSDVVSVFNTINTTGLDLNATDVFKFRYYDYLCSVDSNKEWMDEINNCYKLIEQSNEKYKSNAKIDMSWILDVYKHIICIEFGFGFSELSKSNLRFFDDIFSDKHYEAKRQQNAGILSFETFSFLVEEFISHYRWIEEKQKMDDYSSNPMELLSTDLMGKTRYGWRYWTIPYIFSFYSLNGKNDADKELIFSKSLKVNLSFVRYFIIYSVLYAKVINDVQNRMCIEFLPMLKKDNSDEICDWIEKQKWYQWDKNNRDDNDLWEKKGFVNSIQTNLFENGTRAHLVCTLIALMAEVKNGKTIPGIRSLLFDWNENPYDIEHIFARNSIKNNQELMPLMNGIGNLVVLERSINRNIKDKPVGKKIEKYKGSRFQVVKDLCASGALDNWDKNAVEKRRDEQIEQIMKFMDTDN